MVWLMQFIAAVVFLAVGVIFSWQLESYSRQSSLDRSSSSFGPQQQQHHPEMLTMLLKLAHLLSFSTMWGAALWVTFMGGLIMFYNLLRHQFGNVRSKMFTVNFTTVSSCGAISMASFGYLLAWKSSSTADKHQLGFLVSALAFNLANLSVFNPMTIKMVKKRHKVERENGIGTEVGWSKNREVAKSNPHLAAMNKNSFMIHVLSSLAHIMALASLAMQSRYLAGNINL